jgi:hypothetical protein
MVSNKALEGQNNNKTQQNEQIMNTEILSVLKYLFFNTVA